jgi:hypothetical protein
MSVLSKELKHIRCQTFSVMESFLIPFCYRKKKGISASTLQGTMRYRPTSVWSETPKRKQPQPQTTNSAVGGRCKFKQ